VYSPPCPSCSLGQLALQAKLPKPSGPMFRSPTLTLPTSDAVPCGSGASASVAVTECVAESGENATRPHWARSEVFVTLTTVRFSDWHEQETVNDSVLGSLGRPFFLLVPVPSASMLMGPLVSRNDRQR